MSVMALSSAGLLGWQGRFPRRPAQAARNGAHTRVMTVALANLTTRKPAGRRWRDWLLMRIVGPQGWLAKAVGRGVYSARSPYW